MDDKKIGAFIKRLREENDLSQQQLADKIYVSRALVTKWESGKISLTSNNLKILSEFFHVSTDEILAGEKKTKENSELIENVKYKIYDKTNSLRKRGKQLSILIFIILFAFLFHFFITFYNSVTIYIISTESENIHIENGILVKMRDKIYLRFEPNFKENKKNVERIRLYFHINENDTILLNTTEFSSITINDFYDTQEYFDFKELKKIINNLYIEVIYNDGNKESVKINTKKDYVNSNMFLGKHKQKKNKFEKEPILPEDIEIKKIFEENKEKAFTVSYKGKEYSVNILDSQIYISSEKDNKKMFYYILDNIYFDKSNNNKTIYTYNISSKSCINGNCDDYQKDYDLFSSILKQI